MSSQTPRFSIAVLRSLVSIIDTRDTKDDDDDDDDVDVNGNSKSNWNISFYRLKLQRYTGIDIISLGLHLAVLPKLLSSMYTQIPSPSYPCTWWTKGEASWRPEEAAQAYLPYSMSIKSCRGVRNCRLHKACSSGCVRPKPIWSCSQILNHQGADTQCFTTGPRKPMATALYYFKKVFDLIDLRILIEKLCRLNLPTRIINWIIDFLSNRSQRIKLSEGCYSEWGSVPSGVPQGTKLGPWLFLVLINDLYVDDLANVWKYVDDTTASEVVAKGNRSCARNIANKVVEWSMQNRVKLNSEKCKDLRISFVKNEPQFAPIVVDGKELERVTSAKLLGLTISSNLMWN